MSIQLSIPEPLEQAALAVREVLLRLDSYNKKRVQHIDVNGPYAAAAMRHVGDLDELMVAMQNYEEAVLACLPSAESQPDIYQMSSAELLAYREADPVYRLGWIRGHKEGLAQPSQAPDAALRLYAQHSKLPDPPDTNKFIEGVRRFLAQLSTRYGKGPLPRYQESTVGYGNV
jgi:hypothetical protein